MFFPCQDAAAASLFRGAALGAAILGAGGMEALFRLPFAVLQCPNIKLKRPGWVHMPSAMTVYALVVVSYFLITGGAAPKPPKIPPNPPKPP